MINATNKPFSAYQFLLISLLITCGFQEMQGQAQFAPADTQLINLLDELGNPQSDANQMQVYWQLSRHLFYKNADQSRAYAQKSLMLARRSGTAQDQAQALSLIGGSLLVEGTYLQAADSLNHALRLLDTDMDTLAINVHNSLGNCYQYLYDYPRALTHYEHSINLAMEMDLEQKSIPARGCMANMLAQRGLYTAALPHVRRALVLAEKYEFDIMQGYSLKDIANLHTHLGRPDSAIMYVERALLLAEKKHNFPYIQADTYVKLSEAYYASGRYKEAIDAAVRAGEISRAVSAKSFIIWAERAAAKGFLALHQYAEARSCAHAAQAIAQDAGLLEEQITSLELLADVYEQSGLPSEALAYERKAVGLWKQQAEKERHLLTELTHRQQAEFESDLERTLTKQEISGSAVFVKNSRMFGGAMILFCLLVAVLIYGIQRRNPEYYRNAFSPTMFSREELAIRTRFVRRMSLFFLILTVPLFFHYLIWGPYELIGIHLFFSFLLLGAYFDAKRNRIDRIVYVTIFAGYIIIALLPLWAGPLHSDN